jgi:hypothetical protein
MGPKSGRHILLAIFYLCAFFSAAATTQHAMADGPITTPTPQINSASDYAVLGTVITYGANAVVVPTADGGLVGASSTADAAAISDLKSAKVNFTALGASATTLQTTDLPTGTYAPGTYKSTAALNTAAGTTITLDASKDVNAQFVFLVDNALTFGASTKIVLTNGASANNVYFVAGLAAGDITIGASSILVGNYESYE